MDQLADAAGLYEASPIGDIPEGQTRGIDLPSVADAIADQVAEVAHRVMMKDQTIRIYALDVRRLGAEYEAQEADRTAGVLSARYQITYLTRPDDLASQPT